MDEQSTDAAKTRAFAASEVRLAAPRARSEGNSAAHVKASMMGGSVTVLTDRGGPAPDAWQSICFCEFDGPRRRKMIREIRG